MAVRIRMAVHGVRNNRIFHIVAVNQRQRRNAKPIELLGVYNPRLKPGESTKTIEWSVQRIKYWLKVGATPSDTVTELLQMVCYVLCSNGIPRLMLCVGWYPCPQQHISTRDPCGGRVGSPPRRSRSYRPAYCVMTDWETHYCYKLLITPTTL